MKMQIRFLILAWVVGLAAACPEARAEVIAYEGFGYSSGYLAISDGGDNSGDPSIDTGVYDNLDDGVSGIDTLTGFQPSELGDPGRNGGDGTWVTSWTKRARGADHGYLIDDTETLSYTDSQGKSLKTTLGKPTFSGSQGLNSWRTFDASTLSSDLTTPNTAGDYSVPRLGKQGSTVWMSFLADRSVEVDGDSSSIWFMAMQFWNKQGKLASGSTDEGENSILFTDRSGGIFRDRAADDWLIWDGANGGDPAGPRGLTAGGFIAGSAAADDDESNGDFFIVVKLDYSALHPTKPAVTDGWADVSVWVDPDLDGVEPSSSPAVTGSVYYAFNGINLSSNTQAASPDPLSTSSIDEVRLGTTYADVSPIALAGIDGDFDGDGDVDGTDFLLWQRGGAPGGATAANLLLWENNYGAPGNVTAASAVPEPASMLLLGIAGVLCVTWRRC